VIAGGTRGDGGPGIVAYLLSAEDNEVALVTGARGLLADAGDGLRAMVDDLAARGAGGRIRRPLGCGLPVQAASRSRLPSKAPQLRIGFLIHRQVHGPHTIGTEIGARPLARPENAVMLVR